jgi:GNAT superfamily N-acetyltransferase
MTKTPSTIEIQPANTRRHRRAMLLFPWRIYRGDPNWVPPVVGERAARLDPGKNALFQHGEAAPFVALGGRGEVVGTIALAVDHRHNRMRGEQVAFFGFFECVDDYGVAQALFDHAAAWARERGLAALRGPQSFGTSDEPGLLIEGRDTPPGLMMAWTAPYYVDFVRRYGFAKWGDSLAYRLYRSDLPSGQGDDGVPPRILRVARYVSRRYGYTLRHADIERWDEEMGLARDIYNQSLATLPDFVAMSEDEWDRHAESLRPLLHPDLVFFVQVDGREVGFGLGLPDINQALRHCNGLRYPWNYAQLWWHSRRLPGLSFKIVALLPEYRGRGLDALIYLQIARCLIRGGYDWVDMSLTAEDNPTTNKLAAGLEARVDKRYRIYSLALQG